MRLAFVTGDCDTGSAQSETLWYATAVAALRAGHQVLVCHRADSAPAHLADLSKRGAQLHLQPPSGGWKPRRPKPTHAALGNFAPHAVLVVQSAPYQLASADHAELRQALLEERFSFVLLCLGEQLQAPTAKLLRQARVVFSAAAICGFSSTQSSELTRAQLNVSLPDVRVLPAGPAEPLVHWLEYIAGRRRASGAAGETNPNTPLPSSTVNMFWHGAPLSRLEQLCMSSFLAHGHSVRLFVYQEPAGVPRGVELLDANHILAERHLFRHAKSGSIAAFADWFRYVLLHERGGIWVDTDVVCLKPLQCSQPLLFGRQDEQIINNAVLGLPARHELSAWMIDCCEFPNRARPYDKRRTRRRKLKRRLFQGNLRGNVAWGENGPVGFTQAARHLGYDHYALPFWHFYPVHFLNWRSIFDGGLQANPHLIAGSSALHLWNEMVRRDPAFHRERRFAADSVFEQLCTRYLKNDS